MQESTVYKFVKLLAPIGIALAVYLLVQQFLKPDTTFCTINDVVNCDAIISGPVAQTLGIPTPLYGLIGYSVILIASFLKMKKLLFSMAAFGLLFCLYIGYREIFELGVICPVCIICQINMIIIFVLSLILLKKKKETIEPEQEQV